MNRKFVSNSNYIFRKVLNNEKCINILKDFIEAMLDIEIEEIELNKYLNEKERYLPKEENFGIADVRLRTKENEEINVGIQFVDGIYVQTKMLMYYSQIHLNQLEYDDKREFAKTITINLLDFKYFKNNRFEQTIRIKTNESDIQLEELEFYVIELPKYICNNPENMTSKDEWVSYLKGEDAISKIKNPYIKLLDELVKKYWLEEKME